MSGFDAIHLQVFNRPVPSNVAPLRRVAPTAAVVLVVAAAAALDLTSRAGIAAASASCSFSSTGNTESISTTGTNLILRRGGAGQILVSDNGGSEKVCGSVTAVDNVAIDLGDTENEQLKFDLEGGLFAPGATPEANGSSEVEFVVSNAGTGTQLVVEGSTGSDAVSFGDRRVFPEFRTVTDVNLDGLADGLTPDGDVVLDPRPESIVVLAGSGNDVVSGAGIGPDNSHPTGTPIAIDDGLGSDVLTGGSSTDLFLPSSGDHGDAFSGGAGDDFIDYSRGSTGVSVSLDDTPNDGTACPGTGCEGDNVRSDIEFVRTTGFNDELVGSAAANSFDPGGGTNTLSGRGGDDQFVDRGGKDDFSGGPGFDSVSYFGELSDITVTLEDVANDGPAGAHDNVRADVEEVDGGHGDDHLVGNATANVLRGADGDDVLNGGAGDDVLGRDGASPGSDVFIGGAGNDTVDYAFAPGDLALSIDGVANDRVPGDPAAGVDNIRTDVENVTGGIGGDHITGDGGSNRLTGGPGDDTLVGLGGDDVLLPGAGIDTINGGPGLDTASFFDATASVTADLLAGSAAGDGPDGLNGIERLAGSPFADHLVGSQGDNRLAGGGGPDVIKGLAGDDVLLGQAGGDSLDGGPDSDVCNQGPGSGSIIHCEH
jgi:Ca2+-binding RTX toxin-like protein